MPTRPVSIETLRLIAAVRDALAEHLGADATVDERPLFGCHAFMVNGKLCLAVKDEDLLVRLPPSEQEATAERHGVVVDSGCRSGGCGSCETRATSGTVTYAQQPDHDVAAGHCLLCVGRPQSALVLEA